MSTPDKIPPLPERIEGLARLAQNLSWSWHRQARDLFRQVDELLWHQTRHNPIRVLQGVDPERLQRLAESGAFLEAYDATVAWLDHERDASQTWFARHHADLGGSGPIAYFCAEFGIHNSVPIYSGGLGVLAGDHCKAASDLGVPLIGLGLFYRHGYFDQRLRLDGWQENTDEIVDTGIIPVAPVPAPDGSPYLATVETFDRPVHIRAWSTQVGRVPLYFLDTDLEENHPDDRTLLSRLYGGGEDLRLRQEWLLGTGGVRVLRALGHHPGAWHANEGHAAFMFLERIRELTTSGASFDQAVAAVRATSVFTTHTPVPAGHDTFDPQQVAECTGPVWEELGISRDRFLALASHPNNHAGRFEMTALALRLSAAVNGVSLRHGAVSRKLWAPFWPGRSPDEVPIGAVTNGVHLATWMANPVMDLLDTHLGVEWGGRRDDRSLWERIDSLDAKALWEVHLRLKDILFRFIREDARRHFADEWKDATQVAGAGTLLDPFALTIGFARRFATYKRANLIFSDPERLHRLLVHPRRPVQLIIAGKAHPADTPGKEILQQVYRFTHDPFYEGRVAFVEDYGMHRAHLLVQGVDLWLNLPRVPHEASGTSGMKAALNGVPQLSTLDGWWEEGFSGKNGWALPSVDANLALEEADALDAEALYQLLEEEIVPLFYRRDDDGIPIDWIDRMRHAIRVAITHFTADRMVKEYTAIAYAPALKGAPLTKMPPPLLAGDAEPPDTPVNGD